MAKMYPKTIELVSCTYTEKLVYKELEKQLPDTYSVYHSVAWVDSKDGQNKTSECDFLIISEDDGFLTCEVKGGDYYRKEGEVYIIGDKYGERQLKRSPMQQADDSSRYFYDLYRDNYNELYKGIYGAVSIFPRYRVDDAVLLDHRTKDVVIDSSDMSNLFIKIKQAFNYYRGLSKNYNSISTSQLNNFKKLIENEIATHVVAGALIEQKSDELAMVNRIQNNIVDLLVNYNRTFITGGAGTGKTWIAMKFAIRAALEGNSTLITTSNKQLVEFFKKQLGTYNNITILTFDELVASDGLNSQLVSEVLLDKYSSYKFRKYDAIIVDEAQDFDQYEAFIIDMHLKTEESSLRVFYDFTQNIKNKNFKDGFDIKNPPFVLRENLRNTENIYSWATDNTDLGKEVITNRVIGPEPVTYKFKTQYDLLNQLEIEITRFVDLSRVDLSTIVVLADHECYDIINDQEIGRWKCADYRLHKKESINISLVEDFKGLEADVVFYVHMLDTPEKYNYVAYTRAVYYLYNFIVK